MEELVFTSSFASNNEYRLLCIDCSQIDKNNKVGNNNNNNSGNSNSSLDNVRQMVERIKQLCKPMQQKQKECKVETEQEEEKEQEEQMLLEKRKKESNSEKSLVLVLRNGRHVIAHDALCTCLVKRLEYSNNLLITLSQISQKQQNKEHELEHVEIQHREKQHSPFTVDATNRVNDNNNTNSSYNVAQTPKYLDHDHLHENKEHPCHQTSQEQCQEELLLLEEEEEKQEKEQEETSKHNILYKIMSQVNSIYTCTNLPQIALGNIYNTYNKPFARWQCFVFNTLQHSLVSVEQLRLITLLKEQENRESISVTISIDSNVLETEVKSPLRYVNANSHSNNVNEDHWEEGLESSKVHNNELTTKVKTNYKKNIEVLSEFDELELNSEDKRCKVLERCEHYTFYDLIKKIPCSPAELSETLTSMGAIIIVADSHNSNNNNSNNNTNNNNDNIRNKNYSKDYIYLLQPAEEYIALHSVLKIFESILLQSSIDIECDAIRVDENDSDDDVIVVANNNGNGRISNSRKRQRSDSSNNSNNNNNNTINAEDDNESVWKDIIDELCPELYPHIVLRSIRSIYGAPSQTHKSKCVLEKSATPTTAKQELEETHKQINNICVENATLLAPSWSNAEVHVHHNHSWQREQSLLLRCFNVPLVVVGLVGYLFHTASHVQHKMLSHCNLEALYLDASFFWHVLESEVLPPWLQYAIIRDKYSLARTNSFSIDTIVNNNNSNINTSTNADDVSNFNNERKYELRSCLLRLLHSHVITITDMDIDNNHNNNINNTTNNNYYYNNANADDIINNYNIPINVNKRDSVDREGEVNSVLKSTSNKERIIVWLPAYTLPTNLEQKVHILAQVKRAYWSLQELTSYLAPVLLSDDKFEYVLARYTHQSHLSPTPNHHNNTVKNTTNNNHKTCSPSQDKLYTFTCEKYQKYNKR